MGDFIAAVSKTDGPASYRDFNTEKDSLHAVEAVFKVLKKYVSEGEMADIRSVLPKELKALCDVKPL